MKRSTLVTSVAACFCFGLAAPLLAAPPSAAGSEPLATATVNSNSPSPTETKVAAAKPTEKCLSDLSAFDAQMRKDGYWLSGSGYGYATR